MMTDHLIDDEAQELLGKIGIKSRFFSEPAQPRDLCRLPRRVRCGKGLVRLIPPHRLRNFEAFGEQVHERGVDIVDAVTILAERWVGHPLRLAYGSGFDKRAVIAYSPPMHGWLVIDKSIGIGSTQVVGAVKRALRQGGYPKVKVGHGGTLDPLASGVLPIALGEATKLAGRMLDSDKVYTFTLAFGTETNTLDLEGSVIATSDVRPSVDAITDVLTRFTGPIRQVPPSFSALKVDGARAYDLARSGVDFDLPARDIVIRRLTLESFTPDSATLTAHVSKGTYIRSLARDIAYALGTVGHVTMLHRVKAGPFGLADAISLDKLAEYAIGARLEACLLPLRAALDDIPALALTPDQADALRVGRALVGIAAPSGLAFAMLGNIPVALVQISDGNVTVERGFNL